MKFVPYSITLGDGETPFDTSIMKNMVFSNQIGLCTEGISHHLLVLSPEDDVSATETRLKALDSAARLGAYLGYLDTLSRMQSVDLRITVDKTDLSEYEIGWIQGNMEVLLDSTFHDLVNAVWDPETLTFTIRSTTSDAADPAAPAAE